MEKATQSTCLITFVTVIIQELHTKSLAANELLLKIVSSNEVNGR